MRKLTKKQNYIVLSLALILSFILMGNTNNNPNMFVARIFKPLSLGSGTLYYSGIIIIFLIYYILKGFNNLKESHMTKTSFRRIVSTILILYIGQSLWVFPIKVYKSFKNDLKAIYFERDLSDLTLVRNDEELSLDGYLKLINCGDKEQSFNLKIKLNYLRKEERKEDYVTLKEEYKLMPKQEKYIQVNEEVLENKYKGFYIDIYREIILFNEESEAIFYIEEIEN